MCRWKMGKTGEAEGVREKREEKRKEKVEGLQI